MGIRGFFSFLMTLSVSLSFAGSARAADAKLVEAFSKLPPSAQLEENWDIMIDALVDFDQLEWEVDLATRFVVPASKAELVDHYEFVKFVFEKVEAAKQRLQEHYEYFPTIVIEDFGPLCDREAVGDAVRQAAFEAGFVDEWEEPSLYVEQISGESAPQANDLRIRPYVPKHSTPRNPEPLNELHRLSERLRAYGRDFDNAHRFEPGRGDKLTAYLDGIDVGRWQACRSEMTRFRKLHKLSSAALRDLTTEELVERRQEIAKLQKSIKALSRRIFPSESLEIALPAQDVEIEEGIDGRPLHGWHFDHDQPSYYVEAIRWWVCKRLDINDFRGEVVVARWDFVGEDPSADTYKPHFFASKRSVSNLYRIHFEINAFAEWEKKLAQLENTIHDLQCERSQSDPEAISFEHTAIRVIR